MVYKTDFKSDAGKKGRFWASFTGIWVEPVRIKPKNRHFKPARKAGAACPQAIVTKLYPKTLLKLDSFP